MKIQLNIDNVRFTRKPTGEECGALRNRLGRSDSIMSVTPEELIECIENGQTFTPAFMAGTDGRSWISQQVFCIDIDNDGEEKYEVEEITSKLEQDYSLYPYFIYHSFSSSENWPKFRIVFILDRPVTDKAEALDYNRRLLSIFVKEFPGAADEKTKDLARLFFGSVKGSVTYRSNYLTHIEEFDELPQIEEEKSLHSREENNVRPERHHYSDDDDRERLLEALEYIPADDYGLWIKIGAACKNAGLSVSDWDNWSMKSVKYVAGECDKKWDSFDRDEAGAGTIIYEASLNGFEPKRSSSKFYDWSSALEDDYIPEDPTTSGAAAPVRSSDNNVPDPEVHPDREYNDNLLQTAFTGTDMINKFIEDVKSPKFETIPSGVSFFDKVTGGGFMRGEIYTLGAAPGTGKTMLCQSIFESIAWRKSDQSKQRRVLYVNLEMSRTQLIARSISRLSWQYQHRDVTAKEILQGFKWSQKDEADNMKMIQLYGDNIAPFFSYNPEGFTNNINDIIRLLTAAGEQAHDRGEEAPLVCIDYLQIVEGSKRDVSENIKEIMYKLKSYAMTYSTTVFLIIATNRASNETGTASVTSGRDTSNIEYSGGLMLTLSYAALEQNRRISAEDKYLLKIPDNSKHTRYTLDDLNSLKSLALTAGRPIPSICRELMLKTVKGRFDGDGSRVILDFDGRHATFTEVDYKRDYTSKSSKSSNFIIEDEDDDE